MFVRASKLAAARESLTAACATVSLLRSQLRQEREERLAAQKEVRRLTDVIVNFKAAGAETGPPIDAKWGRYSIAEVEEQLVASPRRTRAPTPEEADVATLEQDLRVALEQF